MGRLNPAGTGMEYYRGVKIAGEDVGEEMAAKQEAVPLDRIHGDDEETRALYADGPARASRPKSRWRNSGCAPCAHTKSNSVEASPIY
ncbi:MAG TPA: hypothetical protein VH639_15880 [Bryobacteraceae bacterium]